MQETRLNTTQRRVFEYMKKNKGITTLDAWTGCGESRLSARIWELKKKGVPVKDRMILVVNRYGERRHVKKYYIPEEE